MAQHAMTRLSQVPSVPALSEAHPGPPLSVLAGVKILRLQDVRRRLRPRQSNGRKYEVRSVGGISVPHAQSPEGEDLSFIFNNEHACHRSPIMTDCSILRLCSTAAELKGIIAIAPFQDRLSPSLPFNHLPSITTSLPSPQMW